MSDSVDITDLVEKTRSAFVDWAVLYVYGLEIAIPGMEWAALPVISNVDKGVIRLVIDGLSKSDVMQGFFLNTAVRKATQASDFVAAVNYLDNLPKTVSDEDYNTAEDAKMAAFRSFVSVAS